MAKTIESYGEKKETRKPFLTREVRKIGRKIITPQKSRKTLFGKPKTRARQTRGLLKLAGVPTQTSRGRPEGSFKYGMPISEWKRLQSQRKRVGELRKEQILREYGRKGYSPEALELLQKQQILSGQVDPKEDVEIQFKRFLAKRSVSPNTMAILERLRRVQNKSQIDDIEMQRRIKERQMVAQAGNLLKARNLFGPDSNKLNLLETKGNILEAPNTFKENPEDNILRQKRLSLLNTKDAGNDLRFGAV